VSPPCQLQQIPLFKPGGVGKGRPPRSYPTRQLLCEPWAYLPRVRQVLAITLMAHLGRYAYFIFCSSVFVFVGLRATTALDTYARDELPQRIHAAMLEDIIKEKLFAHNSIDATAVEGREKPAKKEKEDTAKPKKKRGRPKKGEQAPPPDPKRIDLQPNRSLEDNIKELPNQCDVGTKRNSKGHTTHWIGYKLHLGVVDGDIPAAAILTSASTHDSQVAIPLMQMTKERLDTLYDLMDAAYDAQGIHDFSRTLGHVPVIDPNKRTGETIPMDPAKKQRYNQRSAAERANSALKDNYGGRFVRVRGAAKVMAHLMFGVIALTAAQVFRLIG